MMKARVAPTVSTAPGARHVVRRLSGRVCQQRDEVLEVGAAPAGDRVPAGSGGIAGEDAGGPEHGVVAGDHVVEGAVAGGAAGDGVDGEVDEAEVLPGVLVGQGDGVHDVQRGRGQAEPAVECGQV